MKKSIGELSFTLVILVALAAIKVFAMDFLPVVLKQIDNSTCCLNAGGEYKSGSCYGASEEYQKCSGNIAIGNVKESTSNINLNSIAIGSTNNNLKSKIAKKYLIDSNKQINNDKNLSSNIKNDIQKITKSVYDSNDIKDTVLLSNSIVSSTVERDNEQINVTAVYSGKNIAKTIIRTDDEITNNYKNLSVMETTNVINTDKYKIDELGNSYYSKLDNFNTNDLNDIFLKNKDSLIKLHAIYDKTIIDTASGFFLNKGVIVTTWNFIKESLNKSDFIEVIYNDYIYKIEGVITFDETLDVAVLKLNSKVGNPVTISNKIANNDVIVAMGTSTGLGFSITTGSMLDKDNMVGSLSIPESYQGGIITNTAGDIIGINKKEGTNGSLSNYTSSTLLKKVQNTINDTSFKDLAIMDVTTLKSQYYYGKYNKEATKINISEELYNNYRGIGDVSNTISLDAVKIASYNGIISFRYINDVYGTIDTMDMALDFRLQLEKSGYELKIDSSKKKYYSGSKYDAVILTEFNYLIIVIIEK